MARVAVGGFQHETNTFAPKKGSFEVFVEADSWPGLIGSVAQGRRAYFRACGPARLR